MNKYDNNPYAELEFAEKESEYFGSKIDAEILRINAIQVPNKIKRFTIGTSSQHEKSMEIMDRQLDNYLVNLE